MPQLLNRIIKLLVGALAANIAGVVFQKVWKLVAGEEETPVPSDPDRGLGEVLAAAAVQGIIFGIVQALVNRGGAAGVEKLAGEHPDA